MSTLAGSAVQAAISAAPIAAQRGTFLVEFSVAGDAGLKSRALTFLQRIDGRLQPTLVNVGSKIEENATLVARGGQMAVNAAAVAHVVVLLAVQAQLVSMERTLKRIEATLDALRQFFDEEKIAQVRGWLRKLAAVRDEVSVAQSTALDEQRWLGIFDAADAEFLQVHELAKRQCEDADTKMERAKLSVQFFGPTGDSLLNEFLKEDRSYQTYCDVRSLTIVGRVAVAQLKSACRKAPGTAPIQEDLEEIAKSAIAHQEVLERRAREFKTIFRGKAHEMSQQGLVIEGAAAFRARSDATVALLRAELGRTSFRAARTARAIVEVTEDGRVRPLALLPELVEER